MTTTKKQLIMIKQALRLGAPKSADNVIRYWNQATGKDLVPEAITRMNLEIFVSHLQDEGKAPSTVKQYSTQLKAALNKVSDQIKLPMGWTKSLTPRATKNVSTYLTDNEIKAFAAYQCKNDNERYVWALFLLECYTGARTSDCEHMDANNIEGGCVKYVSQKTKNAATIPCKPIVGEILSKGYNKLTTVAESTKNQIIQRICTRQGIDSVVKVYEKGKEMTGEKWKFITSHSGRRSFATNLYLKECDLYSISKMMGHSSVVMTEGYICCQQRELSAKVMAYFA